MGTRPPIRVLIVDDEPLARRRLKRLLARDVEVEVVGSCGGAAEALRTAREAAPDLIFLDVQMPRMDGFEFLRTLKPGRLPLIIFVTAHDEYALQAFDVYALDYLLKPFDDERFERALQRAKQHLHDHTETVPNSRVESLLDALRSESSRLDRVLVKADGRAFFVRTDEIDWVEAEGKYVRLHAGRQSYLLRAGISELELQLEPKKFLRIHRSTIVNVERIKEMRPWFHGEYEVVLLDGTLLRLSRRYRSKLKEIAGYSL
jgi:two-component system LytT family response regulator